MRADLVRIYLRNVLFCFGFVCVFDSVVFANNSFYIGLSNYVSRKKQLETVSNNLANANTIGFQEENLLFREKTKKTSRKSHNSYVDANRSYISEEVGQLRSTGRNLDVAVIGGYFKLFTADGYRYTLDGNMFISKEGILVNSRGFPYMNAYDAEIQIAEDELDFLVISEDGGIYFNELEISKIGVFALNRNEIKKDEAGLYRSFGAERLSDDFRVLSGFLNQSNVSHIKASTQMMSLQDSAKNSGNALKTTSDFETNLVNKILK